MRYKAFAAPCLVFVALDDNSFDTYERHGTPSWLQEFRPTGRQIATDRATYAVFAKQVPSGRIALGPPCLDANANAMYFAFFAETE